MVAERKDYIVIGLTGPNAAGKGEICKYLARKGFYITSLSDILRKIAKQRGIFPSRINLVNLGNELREKFGSDILAKWLIEEICKSRENRIVVDSIRTPGEIKLLKKNFKDAFHLIHVTAPKKIRFQYILSRGRDGDPKTYKEFLEIEKKECSKKAVQQQIHKCQQLSDFFINNNSTLEELYKKVNTILHKILNSEENK